MPRREDTTRLTDCRQDAQKIALKSADLEIQKINKNWTILLSFWGSSKCSILNDFVHSLTLHEDDFCITVTILVKYKAVIKVSKNFAVFAYFWRFFGPQNLSSLDTVTGAFSELSFGHFYLYIFAKRGLKTAFGGLEILPDGDRLKKSVIFCP